MPRRRACRPVVGGHAYDDIAILITHTHGVGDGRVHRLAWDAFLEGTAVAKAEGLSGAGQDLLKDAFFGNVRGMGPAVAELEFEGRPGEPWPAASGSWAWTWPTPRASGSSS